MPRMLMLKVWSRLPPLFSLYLSDLAWLYVFEHMKSPRKDGKYFSKWEMLYEPEIDAVYPVVFDQDALDIIHWKAGVDGDNVEFVLGSISITKKAPTAAKILETSEPVSHRNKSDILFTIRSVGI